MARTPNALYLHSLAEVVCPKLALDGLIEN